MKFINVLVGLVVVVFTAMGLFFYMVFFRLPANATKVFLRRGRSASTQKVVVCLGDSLTHATLSGDYVAMLRERFGAQGYEFVNAGINGDTTHGLLKRLDDVIACQPDYVTILIGTNDVNATRSTQAAIQYLLPYEPTLSQYLKNYTTILKRLKSETNARIAILSIPPLGEDLDSKINQRVVQYCGAMKELARAEGVIYLPLYEGLREILEGHQANSTFTGDMRLIIGAGVKRYLSGKGFDDISADYGYRVLTDAIHLNDRGAAVAAKLIGAFIK